MGKLMVTLVTHHHGRSERNGMKSITVQVWLMAFCISEILLKTGTKAGA